MRITVPIAIASVFASSACGKEPAIVRVDGSSTVFPILEAAAEQYKQKEASTRVSVGLSGTGGGFKKFCAGETDISDASRPIKPSEVEACKKAGIEWIELPIAFDGIAVVVNPKNDWATTLTTAELKRMWEPEAQKKVMKWSDVRSDFPDRELHLLGPGVDSGTYDYFTEAVVGKEHSSRGDYTASEDDNVLVQGLANDETALGFFGLAYFEANKDKIKLIPIDDGKDDNGKGPIAPTTETVKSGTYQPLSRPLFIYVSKKSIERPDVARFVDFVLGEAKSFVSETGYIPLPDKAYELAMARAKAKTTGSVFAGGSQVGVSIEDLLSREGGEKK